MVMSLLSTESILSSSILLSTLRVLPIMFGILVHRLLCWIFFCMCRRFYFYLPTCSTKIVLLKCYDGLYGMDLEN